MARNTSHSPGRGKIILTHVYTSCADSGLINSRRVCCACSDGHDAVWNRGDGKNKTCFRVRECVRVIIRLCLGRWRSLFTDGH